MSTAISAVVVARFTAERPEFLVLKSKSGWDIPQLPLEDTLDDLLAKLSLSIFTASPKPAFSVVSHDDFPGVEGPALILNTAGEILPLIEDAEVFDAKWVSSEEAFYLIRTNRDALMDLAKRVLKKLLKAPKE